MPEVGGDDVGGPDDTPRRARLWELDCTALTTLLGTVFAPEALLERVGAYAEPEREEERHDPAWGLWAAHRFCHGENAFSLAVEEELESRHPEVLRWARTSCHGRVVRSVRQDVVPPEHLPFVVWALLTDAEPQRRALGHYLVHTYLQRGLGLFRLRPETGRGAACRGTAAPESGRVRALEEEVRTLREALEAREQALDRCLAWIQATRSQAAPLRDA